MLRYDGEGRLARRLVRLGLAYRWAGMSVTRRNPSVCSETSESELSGGLSESRRVLSELKSLGKKKEKEKQAQKESLTD